MIEQTRSGKYYGYDVIENGMKIGRFNLLNPCAGVMQLWNFYIAEEFRGHGFGKQVLLKIIQSLKETGIKQLELYVLPDNTKAIKLYESVGFTIQPDSEKMFTIKMSLKL